MSLIVKGGRGHRPPLPDEVEVRGQIVPLDSDGDGVADFLDRCPDTIVGNTVNSDGCSIDQLCPCDGPWRNHGQYVTCMNKALEHFIREGLIAEAEGRLLLQSAAQSDCGKNEPAAR